VLPRPLDAFVAAGRDSWLGLDFDGSLSGIVDDPAAARILPAAHDALARLVTHVGGIAVVSGRPAAFLAERVGIAGITYAGIYGLERWETEGSHGRVVPHPSVGEWAPVVADLADDAEVALPGVLVERKGTVSVTLHWRTAPERGDVAEAWAQAAATRLGLHLLPGRMAAELRPPVPVDKGTTVAALARRATVAAFAGDDAGDLPAFSALRDLDAAGALAAAITIGVRSDESPAEVAGQDVVVDGPEGLAMLLDSLADALGV
jgi:trehalose 6-phosphate phosphatase